jgi:penicillin G amidase
VLLMMLGLGLWWWLFRSALPQVRGTLRAPGLGASVRVDRDRWGVPHIHAASRYDAFFAQGYVHVQDRLWQMELNRRVGRGRLAELFGAVALDADRFVRRVGLHRAAAAEWAATGPEERRALEAYARGVNAAMAAARTRLPLEFRLLKVRPERWTPVDSLAWSKVMALGSTQNWERELFRSRLLEQASPEEAARLEPFYPAGHPLVLPPGSAAPDLTAELRALLEQARGFVPADTIGASNNWAVAGTRTATGKPLFANDPHLPLQWPSLFYEVQLKAPGLDVAGASLPGLPGVLIGRTAGVAWGITNSEADVSDLFVERFHPEDPSLYAFEGEWRRAEAVEERIHVKGAESVTEQVWITHHGPVLTGGPAGGKTEGLALAWTALRLGGTMRALLEIIAAEDSAAFRQALTSWSAPSLNFTFADTAGNIGYVMAGDLPLRRAGTGLVPVPGWDGGYEWEGLVPFADLPQAWNPEVGYIVTANNAVVDQSYPHHVSWDWMTGYRAQRIADRLKAEAVVTPERCAQIQMDVFTLPGLEFASACRSLSPAGPLERAALDALLAWDGQAAPESVGAAVYELMQDAAIRLAYGPMLGELMDEYLGKSAHPLAEANNCTGRAVTVLLRDLAEGRHVPLLAKALAAAATELTTRLGPDSARWQWGRLHRLQLIHPMAAAVKPLRAIFGLIDVPIGGNNHTPLQTAWVPHRPWLAQSHAPAYRLVADLAQPHAALTVIPGGQSGHARSAHYRDQFPLWHRGELHRLYGEPVEASLELVP